MALQGVVSEPHGAVKSSALGLWGQPIFGSLVMKL